MTQKLNLKIIVIDDNSAIHADFIKILTRSKPSYDSVLKNIGKELFGNNIETPLLPNFIIDTASQGKEGVNKIAAAIKNGSPYALAFVDVRMPPGWDGVETIKHIWELDKNIQIVICTAYSDYTWEETIAQLGQTDNLLILKKPFDNIAVRQLACALTKKWQLMDDAIEYSSSLESRVEERTKSLSDSLSRIRATLESSADGIIVLDENGYVNDYNKKFVKMWNLPDLIMTTNDFKLICKFISKSVEPGDHVLTIFSEVNHHFDKIILDVVKLKNKMVYEYYSQPYTLDNKMNGRVWSFRNITMRATFEAELHYKATHDMLTSLPNRVLLTEKIKSAVLFSEKFKSIFGVLFLDLDRFKLINDSVSHEAGDHILRLVSSRLQSVMRKSDILARLGGDEFVVIANDLKNRNELISIAKKILLSFKEPFNIKNHELYLSTSIGISIYPKDGKNIDELMRNADTAMYLSKESGANKFSFYTSDMNQKNVQRMETEAALRQAIARNEFILYYQPQVDTKTGRLVSFEALIRWMHPTKGMILPIQFIPIAEESGLIVPIGEWVLRTACKQAKDWQNNGLPATRVAVNVTTKQFRTHDFVETVKSILHDCDLAPMYLELELTENMIVNNIDMISMITELKNYGIQIALDDFGTGYSSLNYLREIPVDRIKIDQSYVQNIDSDRGDDIIIQAIIAMAKSLNLDVIAEGVETQRQLDFLRDNKCANVQGYYFSKPIPSSKCEDYIMRFSNIEETVA